MARALLDKASYSLVRTNPKLTGNVKVVSDGTDIYLESFSANTRLSSQKFKAFKVDGTSTYDQDVFKFFNFGKFPAESAYEIFQEYEDDAVLSKYGNQYEMFYCAGTRSIASESYPESLGTLAPLWLNQQIPNSFVIFRLDDPAAVNNLNATSENEGTDSAQTSINFTKQVLENCTAIKTFDLSEGTPLGSYIRNYRNQENFPEVPLTMTWRKDEPILWNGISYKSGGFSSSGNFAYKDLVTLDSTIIQDEYLFTQGFENNGILLANLLNLEFLFDDPTANDYSINRYFGMYVNEVEEGKFDISGEAFYKNTEKSQLPKIKTITEVSQYLNTPFEITNEQGILLFLDPTKTETITGLPTPARVDSVESIFYVKDKEDDFHTIKKGSIWGKDQIRLFDTKVDISLFAGYQEPDTFANASIIEHEGLAQMYIKLTGGISGNALSNGTATANTTNNYGSGVPIVLYNPSGNIIVGSTLENASNQNSVIPLNTQVTSVVYNYNGLSATPTTPVTATVVLTQSVDLNEGDFLTFTSPMPRVEQIPTGVRIKFYDGFDFTGEVIADSSVATVPGKSVQNFFNPFGSIEEVVQSMTSAINKGISENKRFFTATFNKDTVYIKSRFGGTRFNRLNFKMDINYPELFDLTTTYPATTVTDPNKNFVGGNDTNNALLKVTLGDQDRFIKGNFVQTTGDYTQIGDWVPYTEEPIYNGLNEIIGYTDIDKYAVITCNDNQIMVTRSNQVALYSDYKPSFGRFSFFDVKDFDFDFHSNLYSQEGELIYEENHYNQTVPNLIPLQYTGVSGNPEIREFYDNGGFYNLIGLFNDAEDQNPDDEYIKSEYIRLEENFLTSQASASRIAPYINKWAWVNGGKDVRNHPYRLNVNEAFGLNNFGPSKWDKIPTASGYSQEWYYLSEFPEYFGKSAIEESWSYFDTAPTDNTEANPATGQIFVPGTFQNVNKNYFDDYFIAQRFTTGGITEIDRQLRYGRFNGGDAKNFSETFLRGVRIIAKPKAKFTEKPDFNARSLSYVPSGEFNDYRFSVMLVPNLPNKPDLQVKFIKNEKWKTVVMLISISYANKCINDDTKSIIDRTSLYSLTSNFRVNPDCSVVYDPGPPQTPKYNSTVLRGAINLLTTTGPVNNIFTVKGIPDNNGVFPKFLEDIRILENGTYGQIKFQVSGDNFVIDGISTITGNDSFLASVFTKNGNPFTLPNSSPNINLMRQATYLIGNGGINQYESVLNRATFGEIFDAVNKGNPTILYETIASDGTQVKNKDGSLAQTFGIELRAQADILKSIYVGVLPDPAKPTAFNLTDVVGYDLSLQKTPRITPIARHAGYYEPYALPLLSFRDPYMNLDFSGITASALPDDSVYKLKVLELCKYKNTQFNSADTNFGQIPNFYYHKVNEQDPSTVLELSRESAFPSLYPLINEIGIDYKDFYIFSSNWEPSYFIKSIDKSQIEPIIGTRSMLEKKSFFGSKYLKVPETIILETFEPSPFVKGAIKQPSLVNGTFMYQDQASVTINKRIIKSEGVRQIRRIKKKPSSPFVTFYLFNEKRLMEYLFTPIKEQFQKYVNELYGWGDLETLDDDVNEYIRENILKLYKIEKVDFYTLASRTKGGDTYTTAELSNVQKISNGLTLNENSASKTLNTNPFDLKLIYNKRTGFTESYGFSITIVKK